MAFSRKRKGSGEEGKSLGKVTCEPPFGLGSMITTKSCVLFPAQLTRYAPISFVIIIGLLRQQISHGLFAVKTPLTFGTGRFDKECEMSKKKQKQMDNEQPDDEEGLRKSEEKYRTLFNSIDEGFVVAELLFNDEDKPFDLLVLETNASFDRMMRTTNAVGKRALEIFPDAEESWFKAYARVLETGKSSRFENYLAPLGSWFELYISRIGGEGSRRFAIVFNDVTSRKQAEQDLRRSEERLRLIIESAKGYAIFTTDADGIINSWNAGAEQVFGWNEAEILGQKAAVTFTPEDRATGEPQKELETAQAKGIAPDIRWHLRKDGSRVFIDGEVRPLRDGQRNGFFKIGRDVTAQRQAEEALHENQKQLKYLNETLEQKVQEKTAEVHQLASDLIKATQRERQRISRVLHDDLQQRIYAIQMQLSFLRDGLPIEHETGRRDVSEIEKELAEIVQMTRNLSIDLSPPILPGEGLSHAIEWLATRMREQYALSVELQAYGSFVIRNEELHVLLFNCVRELLFNVVKHAGASRAVVTLAWLEKGLRVEVQDDGKGFPDHRPEEQLSKQDDLPRSLGLPTIRHQLSLFGGTMKINSKPGAGTQILLITPVTEARQEVSSSAGSL
jgi:PAS domain S-box-containing protein